MLPVGLDILGRPKGKNRIAHGLQPWEDGPERNRPERAAEGRSLFPKITLGSGLPAPFFRLSICIAPCPDPLPQSAFRIPQFPNPAQSGKGCNFCSSRWLGNWEVSQPPPRACTSATLAISRFSWTRRAVSWSVRRVT